jgi:hypothetical protein
LPPVTMAPKAFPLPSWLTDMLNWDGKSDISRVLNTAFGDANYLDWIKNLKERGIKPLSYINSLDKVCVPSSSTRRAKS